MSTLYGKSIYGMLVDDMERFIPKPDYYSKRKYGKWTIYNKDGMRVAWGLNEREMKNYMKLLEEKD